MIRKLFLTFAALIALASAALTSPAWADANIRIVVPARDIARGEVIASTDLTYGTVTGTAMMSGTVTSMEAATGLEARRVLRAGEPLSASDLRRPVVVNKGQTVTMTFDAPGVQLTAMGRAMSEGGVGDTVTVQNPVSFRMVTAIVIAAGTVRASGPLSSGNLTSPTSQFTARK